jgi:hypothetical protein
MAPSSEKAWHGALHLSLYARSLARHGGEAIDAAQRPQRRRPAEAGRRGASGVIDQGDA